MLKRIGRFILPLILIVLPLSFGAAANLAESTTYLPMVMVADEQIPQPTLPSPIIKITHIEYDPPGDDVQGEYVKIENQGLVPAILDDWTLQDNATTPHVYTFPALTLQTGASIYVWVKDGVDDSSNLYWGSAQAIWNNDGDCAYLKDSNGTLVDTYCYTP